MKEEEAFANWLQKNNPKITKLLMKKQLEERKRKKEKTEKTVNTAKDLILNHSFLAKTDRTNTFLNGRELTSIDTTE
jgi:hypothetical protein